MAAIAGWTPRLWVTRIIRGAPVRTLVWDPDVAHRSGLLDDVGPRNRLRMEAGGWVYERSELTDDTGAGSARGAGRPAPVGLSSRRSRRRARRSRRGSRPRPARRR